MNTESVREEIAEQGRLARKAARVLATASAEQKNRALDAVAQALLDRRGEAIAANEADLDAGRRGGLSDALLDRLALSEARLADIVEGVRQVRALPDPVGDVLLRRTLPNGLELTRRRVPLGVIGIIYEARPNVTVDAAVLCLKAGNAAILRGGKEASRSNAALMTILRDAVESAGLPRDCVAGVADTSRESARALMDLTEYLDVLIPRGGAGLIRTVTQNARVPVIRTGEGVCHVYVDRDADLAMAVRILENAKCSRPSVCNAAECALVDRAVAADFLPRLQRALGKYPVELRGCPETCAILPDAVPATEADWDAEYGDYILAVRVVSGVEEAMDFIAEHGTMHSEAIVTENDETARRFLDGVDAAAVYHNASTRFTDGFQFGLGAEIGISTQKLHARGPMGLEELTSYQYVVRGAGQVRE